MRLSILKARRTHLHPKELDVGQVEVALLVSEWIQGGDTLTVSLPLPGELLPGYLDRGKYIAPVRAKAVRIVGFIVDKVILDD
jgi:hypothetical protein